jgi:leucyl aminopeptidase
MTISQLTLCYSQIVDLATLTGACMIALGNQVAGVWTDNDDLAANLSECSTETGDKR